MDGISYDEVEIDINSNPVIFGLKLVIAAFHKKEFLSVLIKTPDDIFSSELKPIMAARIHPSLLLMCSNSFISYFPFSSPLFTITRPNLLTA